MWLGGCEVRKGENESAVKTVTFTPITPLGSYLEVMALLMLSTGAQAEAERKAELQLVKLGFWL